MPEMDGYEATAAHPPASRAHARPHADHRDDRRGDGGRPRACLAAGMDDYITKPVRPEVLSAVLDRWIALETESGEPSAASRRQHVRTARARQRWAGRPSTVSASRCSASLDDGDGTPVAHVGRRVPRQRPAGRCAARGGR